MIDTVTKITVAYGDLSLTGLTYLMLIDIIRLSLIEDY